MSKALPEVRDAVTSAALLLESAGAVINSASIPTPERVMQTHFPLATIEAATFHESNFADYSNHGETVRGYLEVDAVTPAATYIRALHEASTLKHELGDAFATIDVILLPATPTPAPKLDAQDIDLGDGTTVSRLEADIFFTALFNDTGAPAISIPAPTNGLPIGVQLAAARGDDDLLLSVAALLERLQQGSTRAEPVR